MLPPVRYPLPTLVLLLVLALLTWQGEAMTRPMRSALAARFRRAVEGPPVPSSSRPQVVAGPVVRRALLLHGDVDVRDRPGGRVEDTIAQRMFVDVYDVWPGQEKPTDYRVGNRRPLGWVGAADLLPWDTRLVLRSPGGTSSRPIVSWTSDTLEVADWAPDAPWRTVRGTSRVRITELPADSVGVWISRGELVRLTALVWELQKPRPVESADRLRIRAILGRLMDDRPLGDEEVNAARKVLPSVAFEGTRPPPLPLEEHLGDVNVRWIAEAAWEGLAFRFLPLSNLP